MIPLIESAHINLAQKKRILFVCSGNACRSQIAEGWTRALFGAQIQALSAGVEAHGLDPHAVSVMAERGIDISRQRSKAFDTFANVSVDLIVTLSDRAANHLRSLRVSQPAIHIPCLSPAKRMRIGETSLSHYREMRDELRDIVRRLIFGKTSSPVPIFSNTTLLGVSVLARTPDPRSGLRRSPALQTDAPGRR